MYFHLLSIIFNIISKTLLWYDAIHDATCIPVNVYIMLYMIIGVSRNRNRVVPASYHNFSCKKWSYCEPAVNPNASESRLLWHFIL